jgi:hypothetical protein
MRFASSVVLALLGLASCASHNTHRVQVDLVADFDTLVDEAYSALVQGWPANEPGGTIGTRVGVEPVMVHWWPLAADPTGAINPFEQQDMAQRIEQRLWQLMGGPPDLSQPPDYVIGAELATDLHDPGSILYGISCSLVRVNDPGRPLAVGFSRLIQAPRLFCHGCNERWSGLGSHLAHPEAVGGAYFGVGVGYSSGFYCPPSSGGGGYTKIR